MEHKTYTRLRQVCLATENIRLSEGILARVLGLSPCHRSTLPDYGLENSLFVIGASFIELVAPIEENTAVARFLKKNNGLGGYMAIFDCEDTALRKQLLNLQFIDIIAERQGEKADLIQLDPRKTGLTMVELDHHKEGRRRMDGYEWAGPNWQKHVYQAVVEDIVKFAFRCHDPIKKADQWRRFLITTKKQAPDKPATIALDHGTLEFESCPTDAKEYFSEIHLITHSRKSVLQRAKEEQLETAEDRFHFCGVDIVLIDSETS
ncbi:hypothetical protein [Sneathiella sp.]|jgi:hypothetical protein|uniref:hypothetical protein n=1 Tax=Sneathiella sp. TaxID=1964365 RepID=UPI0039E482AB